MAYSNMEMSSLLGYLVNEYGVDLFKKKQKVRMKIYLENKLYHEDIVNTFKYKEGTHYIKYIKYDVVKKVFKFVTTKDKKIKLPFSITEISVEFDY